MAGLSHEQWRDLLEKRLTHRWVRERTGMAVFDAYFEGDHNLRFASAAYREAFGPYLSATADNWMPLIVQATAERLTVQGFRYGDDETTADLAWASWQANGLDAESKMAHTEAIKLGEAYWLVAPPQDRDGPALVTCEHPAQVIVASDPANRRKRLAALKKFVDDDGVAHCWLYLPEGNVKWNSDGALHKTGMVGTDIKWVLDEAATGDHNWGVVPMIPLRNAPSMLGGATSDLQVAVPIQDVINKLLADMMLGAEYQAFPQRVLLGVEKMVDANGQVLTAEKAQIQLSRARVLRFGSKDAKIGEWTAADLKNYVEARQHMVRGLTAKTRTPPHYVLGEIINASGDALTAAETGLASKTEDKQPDLAEGHEEMSRLSFKAIGDDARAKITDSETVWKDVEKKTFAQRVDGATKMLTGLNLPEEMAWEAMGLSPQQIARAKTLNEVNALLNPPPPVPDPNAPPASNGVVSPEQMPPVPV